MTPALLVDLLVGLLFGFLDYDGATASASSINTTFGLFDQEAVFRWSMLLFWGYFVFLGFYRYKCVLPKTPQLLKALCTIVASFYLFSSLRLFLHTHALSTFGIYEYRNLSLFAVLAFAVLNVSTHQHLRSFLIGWVCMTGCRAVFNTILLLFGVEHFQANLDVFYTTFDGTVLSQECVCAVFGLALYNRMKMQGRVAAALGYAVMVGGMLIDSVGSFRRHVYVRYFVMLACAALFAPTKRRFKPLIAVAAVGVLMVAASYAIFGAENVRNRAASLRLSGFDKTMDASNQFYLDSWTLQLALAVKRPLQGYGLRNESLGYNVDGEEIPIHTGFHAIWIEEGLVGFAVQGYCFVVLPLLFFAASRRTSVTGGSVLLMALVGFALFEGLFPFKDAVIGNIKTCVGIGILCGLVTKRMADYGRNNVRVYMGSAALLEIL